MQRRYAIFLIALSVILAPALSHGADDTKPEVESAIIQIDINAADAATLATIKGIGPRKAAAIVAYRKQIGGFKSIEQLLDVKGVGEKLLLKIKPRITM